MWSARHPFGDDCGMSDIMFRDDAEAAYQRYEEQGFFCEPDLFSAVECEALIEAARVLPTARDGSLIPVMNVHKIDTVFLRAMSKPGILRVMDRLIGGQANGLHSQFYFTPPGRRGLGCHQDNYFAEVKPDAFASAWLALVDIYPENGGLYVFPGSHKEGRLPVKPSDAGGADKRQAVYEETIVPARYPRLDVRVKRGTVVFLHGYLAHGSHINRSRSNRYALLNTYIRERERYRRGETALREEHQLLREGV